MRDYLRRLQVGAVFLVIAASGCVAQTAPRGVAKSAVSPAANDVAFGARVLNDTQHAAGAYTRAKLNCTSCHLQNGLKREGEYLGSAFVRYPRYSVRAGRVISLEDRILECFLRSMNGSAPPQDGAVVRGVVAYLRSLNGKQIADIEPARVAAPGVPSIQRGAAVYQIKCAACHATNGAGIGGMPPLWGRWSFNGAAGMASVKTMAAFVRANMPLGTAPNTLSAKEATDVTAFVLSHARPVFDGKRVVGNPPLPASAY